ncbi:MAG TPA: urate hydroxylase PuuD, partial [Chitinophagaceae bacterium]|nr:urate hydroxylase PuuD [Chitinophagaceae bacterium]
MLPIILLVILFLVLVLMIVMTYSIRSIAHHDTKNEEDQGKASLIQGWLYAGIVATIIAIIAGIYFLVKGTPYEGHVIEWLNIVVRVMHITFGIAWIGASFYFVFLENALNRTDNVRDELAGNLWAIHGGGFYYLEKYKVAPKTIPKSLHWFKYE